MSFNDEMVRIAHEWAEQEGASAIDAEAAADYALQQRLYDRQPPSQRELCIRDMRRALQQAKFTDAQGNVVRAKHALRIVGEQLELPITIYVDPRTAKPDQMYEAFKQSLDGIKNDVKRHALKLAHMTSTTSITPLYRSSTTISRKSQRRLDQLVNTTTPTTMRTFLLRSQS